MKPYEDIEIGVDYIIRKFNSDIDSIDLKWHRDEENRIIEAIEETDWLIQIDDMLPQTLNEKVFIRKEEYHRLIKGSKDLILKVIKC